MKFILIEIQDNNGVVGNIVRDYDNKNEAESAFYSVLSSAAISQVDIHSAVLVSSDAELYMSGCYKHPKEEE